MRCIPVCTKKGVEELAVLARGIWQEYWPQRIGQAQTDYMVSRFQSFDALSEDINANGYWYWFLEDEGRVLGYTGARIEEENGRLFLSKIYLLSEERGRGYASETLKFYEKLCRENGLKAIYLTVNKGNDLAIRAYLAKGFETIDTVETDIGEGFIMDDFIMEKQVDISQ